MQFNEKKYSIKISKNNTVLYCNKKNILTIIGPLTKKSLKLKLKIKIFENKKTILVLSTPLTELSNNEKKNIKSLKGTTVALVKQLILETSSVMYKKLKFVGVGYRGFEVENFNYKLLMLKLGYSHSIYFKTPKSLNIFCFKLTKLFIYGSTYHDVTQTASLIRSYKKPEPYKGKGILYDNELIKLKKGKKNLK